MTRKSGISGCRVQAISARSGISSATFFNYFPSKESVLLEWLDDQLGSLFDEACHRHHAGSPLRRVLRRLAQRLAELAAEEPIACRVASQSCRFTEAVAEPPGRGRVTEEAPALRLIEQARDREEIRADVEPRLAAMVLRVTLIGGLAAGLAEDPVDSSAPLTARLRSLVDLWTDGLRKRNERVQSAEPGVRGARVSGRADS
ncbi:TetR/AcrR family transcriptional regulator [Myxococcota bacterium]|nr:TetR/AcrR family transcriptional regulator [Myxococcota bacterium]